MAELASGGGSLHYHNNYGRLGFVPCKAEQLYMRRKGSPTAVGP